MFNAKPVQSVYRFSQAYYDLIVITRSIVQETQCSFKGMCIHSYQEKHKIRDNLTLVQQTNTQADRKIDKIQSTQLYYPTIIPIVQPSLPIWLTHNDIHITNKINKSTI